ncbi:MAG: B12-binding domain-containing radical SAM protein, partial [Burkholderiaceae bacterium]
YAHASLGLRCLRANLGDLRARSAIAEFVVDRRAEEIVERLLAALDGGAPRIVGFGVYIWNVEATTRVVAQLKTVAPDVVVVVGGPEVSHEVDAQRICALADYVVTGWGDVTFARLAQAIVSGPRPSTKVHRGDRPPLDSIALPYAEYTDEDLRHRYVYVEASRGCPFRCEFCLSALDETAWPFALEPLLAELARLYERGARHFKFVDRTFNLKAETGRAILDFFLARIDARPDDPPFVHFELIPDRLPDRLREPIARFPPGTLQFEIGIQTFNEDVQKLISRRQDNAAAEANLRWLRAHTN